MPSVESMATARTRSSPRCCCTSAISVRLVPSGLRDVDREGGVDLGKPVCEDGVDDDALDLDDPAGVRAGRSVLGHGSPVARSSAGLRRRGNARTCHRVYLRAGRRRAGSVERERLVAPDELDLEPVGDEGGKREVRLVPALEVETLRAAGAGRRTRAGAMSCAVASRSTESWWSAFVSFSVSSSYPSRTSSPSSSDAAASIAAAASFMRLRNSSCVFGLGDPGEREVDAVAGA